MHNNRAMTSVWVDRLSVSQRSADRSTRWSPLLSELLSKFQNIILPYIIATIKFSLWIDQNIFYRNILWINIARNIIVRRDDKCVGRSIKSVSRRLEISRPVYHDRLVDHPCCLELRRVKRGTRLHHFARLSSEWTRAHLADTRVPTVPFWYSRHV